MFCLFHFISIFQKVQKIENYMLYQVENPWIAKFSALFHINLPNEIVNIRPSEILSCQNCEIIEIPAKLSTSKLIRYWFVSIGGRWNFSISSNVSSTVSKANDFLKSNQPGQAAVVLDALTVLLLAADNERYANLQRYFISFSEKSTTCLVGRSTGLQILLKWRQLCCTAILNLKKTWRSWGVSPPSPKFVLSPHQPALSSPSLLSIPHLLQNSKSRSNINT